MALWAVAGTLIWAGDRAAGGARWRPDPESVAPVAPVCGELVVPTGDDPLAVLVEAGEQARAHETRCGPAEPQRRLCRALWLARQLDPVVVRHRSSEADADPELVRRAGELVAWTLQDAAAVADAEGLEAVDFEAGTSDAGLAGALRRLAESNARLSALPVAASTDGERAALLQARAASDVVVPLARAEDRCQ